MHLPPPAMEYTDAMFESALRLLEKHPHYEGPRLSDPLLPALTPLGLGDPYSYFVLSAYRLYDRMKSTQTPRIEALVTVLRLSAKGRMLDVDGTLVALMHAKLDALDALAQAHIKGDPLPTLSLPHPLPPVPANRFWTMEAFQAMAVLCAPHGRTPDRSLLVAWGMHTVGPYDVLICYTTYARLLKDYEAGGRLRTLENHLAILERSKARVHQVRHLFPEPLWTLFFFKCNALKHLFSKAYEPMHTLRSGKTYCPP